MCLSRSVAEGRNDQFYELRTTYAKDTTGSRIDKRKWIQNSVQCKGTRDLERLDHAHRSDELILEGVFISHRARRGVLIQITDM